MLMSKWCNFNFPFFFLNVIEEKIWCTNTRNSILKTLILIRFIFIIIIFFDGFFWSGHLPQPIQEKKNYILV